MSSQSEENGTTRQRCSPEEKVRIVRRHLKDHAGLADLAGKQEGPPTDSGGAKQALEGIGQTSSREIQQQRKVLDREIREKGDRIRRLESAVSDLSTGNPLLKKADGFPLTGTPVAPETAEAVIKTRTL